jgi:hypothetical protein
MDRTGSGACDPPIQPVLCMLLAAQAEAEYAKAAAAAVKEVPPL